MKLKTPKTCTMIAIAFFVLVTVIELCVFGNILNAWTGAIWRTGAVIFTTAFVNVSLWFFALKYHQTYESINKTTHK